MLITIVSVTGWTITFTFAVFVRPVIELVAVTVKVKVCAGVSSGTEGAVKVTLAPVVADKPVAGDQVKVDVHGTPGASAGSTQLALSKTDAPLGTVMVVPVTVAGGVGKPGVTTGAGFVQLADALTDGGVPAGAMMTGTIKLAGADCGTLLLCPPTTRENVRFCAPAMAGTTKVGLAANGSLIVTVGSPGLMICAHWNGPVGGLLLVPSSVTVIPADGGFGLEVNFGTASVVIAPGTQVSGGRVLSGNGFSCPITWLG